MYIATYAPDLNRCAYMWYARKCETKARTKLIKPHELYKLKDKILSGDCKSIAVTCDTGRKSIDKLFGYPVLAPHDVAYGNIVGCSVTARLGSRACRVTALPTQPMLNSSRVDKLMSYRFIDRAMGQPGFYEPPTKMHERVKQEYDENYDSVVQMLEGRFINHSGRLFIPAGIAIDLETVETITVDHPDIPGETCTFGACIDVFGCAIGGCLNPF